MAPLNTGLVLRQTTCNVFSMTEIAGLTEIDGMTTMQTEIAETIMASLPGKPAQLAKGRYYVTRDGKAVRNNQCSVTVWMQISKL